MLDYLCFKEISELFASGNVGEARQLLMEIQSRCIALRDEMAMLKLRLQNMEDTLNLAQNLFLEHGFYWVRTKGIRLGPYCPRCYEVDGALIHLEKCGQSLGCPYCGELYRKKQQPMSENTQIVPPANVLHFVR